MEICLLWLEIFYRIYLVKSFFWMVALSSLGTVHRIEFIVVALVSVIPQISLDDLGS